MRNRCQDRGFARSNKRWTYSFPHLAAPCRRNDEISVDVVVPKVLIPRTSIPGFNLVFSVEMSQRRLCHVDASVGNRKKFF